MEYEEIINKQPLGSIERLFLIYKYANKKQSKAAYRCIKKRLKRKLNSSFNRKNEI